MNFSIARECRSSGSPNNATDAASFKKYNKELVLFYSLFFSWCLHNRKVVLSFVMNFEKFWSLQTAAVYSNILTAHPSTSKTCKLVEGATLLVPGH